LGKIRQSYTDDLGKLSGYSSNNTISLLMYIRAKNLGKI